MAARAARVARHFENRGGEGEKGAPKAKAKPPRFAMKKDARTATATTFLQKNMPPDIVAVEDDYNGRWRILSPQTGEWRSVSWSKRGFPAAIQLALYWAWLFYEPYTGQGPPFNMNELIEEIVDIDD